MVIKASKAELKTSELALPKRLPSILAKIRSSESLGEGEPGDGGDMRDVGSESNRTDLRACRHERAKHVRRVNRSSGSDGPCGMCSGRDPGSGAWSPQPAHILASTASQASWSAVANDDGSVITTVIFGFEFLVAKKTRAKEKLVSP